MEFAFLIILFLAMGWGTVRLNRTLQQRRQAQQALPSADALQRSAPTPTPPNRLDTWRQEIWPKSPRAATGAELAPAFRTWVETTLNHEAKLQAWLLTLSPEQLQALVEHLAAYCEQLKVKLAWLTERRIDVAPVLKSTTQEIVVAYCTGLWKATAIKSKLELFIEYQQFTQLTTAQQQQIMQRELLARLAAQNLVGVPSLAATLIGTEAERQAKVVEALQQVATKDWERFITIFQSTIQPPLPTPIHQNGVHPKNQQ